VPAQVDGNDLLLAALGASVPCQALVARRFHSADGAQAVAAKNANEVLKG